MKNKYVFWLIAAIVALAIFISCARPRSPKEKQIPETDTIEQVVAPTVQEVLQCQGPHYHNLIVIQFMKPLTIKLNKVTSVCEDRSNRFYCENQ